MSPRWSGNIRGYCRAWPALLSGGHCGPGGADGKEPDASVGDVRDFGVIPGSGSSPMGEHGDPLQCSCLENPMDRGTWRATGHGVAKTRARLKPFSTRLAWLPGLPSVAWKGVWGGRWPRERKQVSFFACISQADCAGRQGCPTQV